MVFEEFFKKKRIDLEALQQAEGSLFSEFKEHFEQMGEKSFDHTKKYWFNKLRRRFPIPIEIKTERLHIANPLAEQTITESLIEPGPPSKVGFTPKFRAAAVAKPVEEKREDPKVEEPAVPTESTTPKPGFKPRFNPAMAKAKPVENTEAPAEKPEVKEESTDQPAAKPGFKPRFNPAMVKPKPVEKETSAPVQPEAAAETVASAEEVPAPKIGFKPRFNAAMVKPKVVEEEKPVEPVLPVASDELTTPNEEAPAPKLGFKPRFNAKNIPPKTDSE